MRSPDSMIGWKNGDVEVLSYSHLSPDGKYVYNTIDHKSGKIHLREGQYLRRRNPKNLKDRRIVVYDPEEGTKYSHSSMMGRCYDPNNNEWNRYGALGIKVHEPWWDLEFFTSAVGFRMRADLTADRTDRLKNYEPGNFEWAGRKRQNRHRSSNRFIDYDNRSVTCIEFSEITGIKASLVYSRVRQNWTAEKIINYYKSKLIQQEMQLAA